MNPNKPRVAILMVTLGVIYTSLVVVTFTLVAFWLVSAVTWFAPLVSALSTAGLGIPLFFLNRFLEKKLNETKT